MRESLGKTQTLSKVTKKGFITSAPSQFFTLKSKETFEAANCTSFIAVIVAMEQRALRNVNNHLNTNICSYLETSGGQSSNLY
jgi:hypothetical protein